MNNQSPPSLLAPMQPMLPLGPVDVAGPGPLDRPPEPARRSPANSSPGSTGSAEGAASDDAPVSPIVTSALSADDEARPAVEQPEVEVRVSTRRRKSASAFWSDGRVVVVLPASMPRSARPEMVEDLVRRVLNYRPHLAASDGDLTRRAGELADRYLDGVRPSSIRWVTNQNSQWGSCTCGTREIRISDRLRVVPGWVLDAVLVHELAHLIEPNHSPRFRSLTERFTRSKEADVFLDGFSLGREYAR